MTQIPAEIAERYEGRLKKAADRSYSGGSPRPSYERLLKTLPGDVHTLVAVINLFGFKRYFGIASQGDIDRVLEAVKNGGGMHTDWYYLVHSDMAPEHQIVVNDIPRSSVSAESRQSRETTASDTNTREKKCAGCGSPNTTNRCARCKSPYCARECQVSHWPIHKGVCRSVE